MAKRHTKSTPSKPAPEAAEGESDPQEEGSPPEVSNLESYLEENRKKIAIIAILAVVAVAVSAWVVFSRSAKEKEAAIEFTKAATVADYNLVIERHGGTVAGGNAALMKSQLQWDSGEQTASLKTLNQFLGNFPDHPLTANGLYAIAVREASMDNADVAKQRLKDVVDKHPESSVAPLAQLYLADLALGEGDKDAAKDLYDAAAKMDPGVVGIVERRVQAIKSETPIVAIEAPPLPKEEEKPPVPPTTPPVPPTTPPVPPTTPPVPPTTPPVPPTTPPVPPTTPPVPPTTPPVPPTTPPVPPTTPPVPPTTPPVPPTTPPVPPTTPLVPPTTTPPAPPTTPPVPPTTPPVPPTTTPPPVPSTTPDSPGSHPIAPEPDVPSSGSHPNPADPANDPSDPAPAPSTIPAPAQEGPAEADPNP